MTGQQNLSVPPAALKVSLPGSKCSLMPCLPLFYTRMAGMWSLFVPHAALKVGLTVSACSPVLCGSPRRFFVPEWRDGGSCQFCTRSRKLDCQEANARTVSACRFLYSNGGNAESACAARAAGGQPRGEYSLHSVPAVQICFRTALFSKHGVWGFAPCSPMALDHFPLPYLCLPHELSFRAILFYFPPMGYGALPHVHQWPLTFALFP